MKIRISEHKGGLYSLYVEQKVKSNIKDVWSFFSTPKNLNKITPNNLNFEITSSNANEFYEGKIFTYRIKLLYLFFFSWTTEITTVKHQSYFIDKQLFGPYKLWHHEHHFKENDDGTITIIDKVQYKLYLHPISKLAHKYFIRKKLMMIFNYRMNKIEKLF